MAVNGTRRKSSPLRTLARSRAGTIIKLSLSPRGGRRSSGHRGAKDASTSVPEGGFQDSSSAGLSDSSGNVAAQIGAPCAHDSDCAYGATCMTSWPGGACTIVGCAGVCPGGSWCSINSGQSDCVPSWAGTARHRQRGRRSGVHTRETSRRRSGRDRASSGGGCDPIDAQSRGRGT